MSNFEVHAYRNSRWVCETAFFKEQDAMKAAETLVSDKNNEGVRVIKEVRHPNGGFEEKVVWEKMTGKSASKKDVGIIAIEDAAYCATLADLYDAPSRGTINRILRKYLEDVTLTPTEILYNARELKRAMETGTLCGSAVDRVAGIQARQRGEDIKGRKDALFGLLDQAEAKARAMEASAEAFRVKKQGFGELWEGVGKKAAAADQDWLALAALARDLIEHRGFLAKMNELLGHASRVRAGSRPMLLIDGAIADVLGCRTIIADMLGSHANLGVSLFQQIDLLEGRLDVTGREQVDPAVQLNRLFAAGALPASKAVLLDRIERQIESNEPLSKTQPNKEMDVLSALVQKVTTQDGLLGGTAMMESLIVRHARSFAQGGATGRRDAAQSITGMPPDLPRRVRLLLACLETSFAADLRDMVTASLEGNLLKAHTITDIVSAKASPKDMMQQITTTYRAMKVSALDEPLRGQLCNKLDGLLSAYIINSGLIEKLDRKEDSLRVRAMRLVQFCTSGILTDGAFNVARQTVVAYLRQPEFETKFVEDITDQAQRDKALREFYNLLDGRFFN